MSAASVSAQTAVLAGTVTDARGEGLAGVVVTAASPARAEPATTVTDAAGAYRIVGLPPGAYTVTFALSGFAESRESVALAPGEQRSIAAALRLIRLSETVDVVAVTPARGTGLDRDRVPAAVSVLDADALAARGTAPLSSSLDGRLGSVSIEGTTTNDWQPTLRFRGFTASPLLGLPQGIAVFQNGVRVNEPFGDTVQFDLLPQFAVARAQLTAGADPTYGLNALGGALTLSLKNGFDYQGFGGEVSAGSFGRLGGTAELGLSQGAWALYAGGSHSDEDGWRVQSPSQVTQAVVDAAYRAGRVEAGLSVTHADTRLNGNGPAPVELLAADRTAVFTYPDTTENRLALVQGRFDVATSRAWSIQATGYYRDLDRRTINGDEADFEPCDGSSLPLGAPADTLCAVDDGGEDDAVRAAPLVDAVTGRFITGADAAGDGAFNRTHTRTQGYGGTVQATFTSPGGRRPNLFVIGVSADLSDVAFASSAEVGSRTADRTVTGSGLYAGIFGVAPDDRFNTDVRSDGRALGVYVYDTLSLTDRAHLTVSGRANHVRLALADQLGTSLDGRHTFARVNPAVGLAYQTGSAATLFGRYAESSRAPTAAEVSCADPTEPCRVPNAFVSDPPLAQVVARSLEGGARGRWTRPGASLDWSAAVFLTRSRDDILFVASPDLIGTGYFQNAGTTQRAGVDLDVSGRVRATDWYVSYGLVDATFRSDLSLPGSHEVNDAADEDGVITVEPGDRLPGIPRHSLKAGLSQQLTSRWNAGIELVGASSRVLVGDEGNDQRELDGYAVVQLRSRYRLDGAVELFLRVDNVLDSRYETFGALAEVDIELAEAPGASDPRFLSPAAPRTVLGGLRVRF